MKLVSPQHNDTFSTMNETNSGAIIKQLFQKMEQRHIDKIIMNIKQIDYHTSFQVLLCIFFSIQLEIHLSLIKPRILSKITQYICEYLMLVLPMMLAYTTLEKSTDVMNFIMFLILLYRLLPFSRSSFKKFQALNEFKSDRIPIITSLRGMTYLITALCILAVDFEVFPRVLGKTGRFGYSLMDTGVGLFVAMSGIVHKDFNSNFMVIVKDNLKILTLAVVFGVIKYVAIEKLDYPERLTEYGVHWNVFLTITICKVFSHFILYFYNDALVLSVLTLFIQEFLLYEGVQDWVFHVYPRHNLLSANREGVSSCLGFVSIYLFAVYLKQVLKNKEVTKYHTIMILLRASVLLWILSYWDLFFPTSRKLANAAYCIFIGAVLTIITCIKYFIIALVEENNVHVPLVLSSINSNGLVYIAIANFLTGVVNLTIKTKEIETAVTFVILNIYMIIPIGIVACLKFSCF